MKRVFVKISVALLCGAMLNSCGEESGDNLIVQTGEQEAQEKKTNSRVGGDVFFEIYEEDNNLGIDSRWNNIPEIPSKTAGIMVIDSNEQLKQCVNGEYTPVDFGKKTLLLVYGYETNQSRPESYALYKTGDNAYRLEVKILGNGMTANNLWRTALLVNKTENASYTIVLKR